MSEYVLHGLWTREQQLALWVEQIDGHRVLKLHDLPPGALPPAIDTLLSPITAKGREKVVLRSPKGRLPVLTVPTTPLLPDMAIKLLAAIAEGAPHAQPEDTPTITALGTSTQWDTIGPELRYLAHLSTALETFARTGRITIGMHAVGNEWYPIFQLAAGPETTQFFAAMEAAAPEVLTRNFGAQLADSFAATLFHHVVLNLIAPNQAIYAAHSLHPFTKALLTTTPLAKGGPQMVSKLNAWRSSVSTVPLSIVILVDDDEGDEFGKPGRTRLESYLATAGAHADEPLFDIKLRLRVGAGAPTTRTDITIPGITDAELNKLHTSVLATAPTLNAGRPAHTVFEPLTDDFGEPIDDSWDVVLTVEELEQFLAHDVPALHKAGIHVMLPKNWSAAMASLSIDTRSHDAAATATAPQLGLDHMVEYALNIDLDGMGLSPQEVEQLLTSHSNLVKVRNNWVIADSAAMRRVRDFVAQLKDTSQRTITTRIEEINARLALLDTLEPSPENTQEHANLTRELAELTKAQNAPTADTIAAADLHRMLLEADKDIPVAFAGDGYHDSLIASIHGTPPDGIDLPETIHAELRHYQQRGVAWLSWMSSHNIGAILADDMGLGKTLQILSLLAYERHHNPTAPATLIIVPTSVVGNWEKEIARFTPSLRTYTHYGPQCAQQHELDEALTNHHIVLTTYGLATRDITQLAAHTFDHVILDEAQAIKNPTTRTAKAVRAIPARQRIALTGTPVENKLSELRALLDWANPGMLGSPNFFRNHFATAIEKYQDPTQTQKLASLTRPFILRRVKTDPAIIDDLPEKNEENILVDLTPEQASLYKTVTEDLLAKIADAKKHHTGPVRGAVFYLITAIKQICNHPAHYAGDNSPIMDNGRHRSGKLKALDHIVEKALAKDEKIIVFTQYAKFGAMLARHLNDTTGGDIPFLHGAVSRTQRDTMVNAFQQPDGPKIMVLSLKAGGTGLNLTAANHVIHMDRWWNPAVENQATDRAFRIGQNKNVHVHKMITRGTLEERINDIITGKIHLANSIIGHGEGWITQLAPEQLAKLVAFREEADDHYIALAHAPRPGENPQWDSPEALDTDAAGKWKPSRVQLPDTDEPTNRLDPLGDAALRPDSAVDDAERGHIIDINTRKNH
ncbi:DEAD/DEAH box helicase [Corynebacterium aquilae]|uniref:DEAD/DEAH box helicase n=1 Tax=Corynebacterium aquilae TaxID=203263 RepID=UPI0012ECD13E|nr:DEAD/DEAH box helicase [Corynebacterium aquilae]